MLETRFVWNYFSKEMKLLFVNSYSNVYNIIKLYQLVLKNTYKTKNKNLGNFSPNKP